MVTAGWHKSSVRHHGWVGHSLCVARAQIAEHGLRSPTPHCNHHLGKSPMSAITRGLLAFTKQFSKGPSIFKCWSSLLRSLKGLPKPCATCYCWGCLGLSAPCSPRPCHASLLHPWAQGRSHPCTIRPGCVGGIMQGPATLWLKGSTA